MHTVLFFVVAMLATVCDSAPIAGRVLVNSSDVLAARHREAHAQLSSLTLYNVLSFTSSGIGRHLLWDGFSGLFMLIKGQSMVGFGSLNCPAAYAFGVNLVHMDFNMVPDGLLCFEWPANVADNGRFTAGLASDGAGGVWMVGSAPHVGTFNLGGTAPLPIAGGEDCYFAHYDNTVNFISQGSVGTTAADQCWGVASAAGEPGHVVIVGRTDAASYSLVPDGPTYASDASGAMDPFLLRVTDGVGEAAVIVGSVAYIPSVMGTDGASFQAVHVISADPSRGRDQPWYVVAGSLGVGASVDFGSKVGVLNGKGSFILHFVEDDGVLASSGAPLAPSPAPPPPLHGVVEDTFRSFTAIRGHVFASGTITVGFLTGHITDAGETGGVWGCFGIIPDPFVFRDFGRVETDVAAGSAGAEIEIRFDEKLDGKAYVAPRGFGSGTIGCSSDYKGGVLVSLAVSSPHTRFGVPMAPDTSESFEFIHSIAEDGSVSWWDYNDATPSSTPQETTAFRANVVLPGGDVFVAGFIGGESEITYSTTAAGPVTLTGAGTKIKLLHYKSDDPTNEPARHYTTSPPGVTLGTRSVGAPTVLSVADGGDGGGYYVVASGATASSFAGGSFNVAERAYAQQVIIARFSAQHSLEAVRVLDWGASPADVGTANAVVDIVGVGGHGVWVLANRGAGTTHVRVGGDVGKVGEEATGLYGTACMVAVRLSRVSLRAVVGLPISGGDAARVPVVGVRATRSEGLGGFYVLLSVTGRRFSFGRALHLSTVAAGGEVGVLLGVLNDGSDAGGVLFYSSTNVVMYGVGAAECGGGGVAPEVKVVFGDSGPNEVSAVDVAGALVTSGGAHAGPLVARIRVGDTPGWLTVFAISALFDSVLGALAGGVPGVVLGKVRVVASSNNDWWMCGRAAGTLQVGAAVHAVATDDFYIKFSAAGVVLHATTATVGAGESAFLDCGGDGQGGLWAVTSFAGGHTHPLGDRTMPAGWTAWHAVSHIKPGGGFDYDERWIGGTYGAASAARGAGIVALSTCEVVVGVVVDMGAGVGGVKYSRDGTKFDIAGGTSGLLRLRHQVGCTKGTWPARVGEVGGVCAGALTWSVAIPEATILYLIRGRGLYDSHDGELWVVAKGFFGTFLSQTPSIGTATDDRVVVARLANTDLTTAVAAQAFVVPGGVIVTVFGGAVTTGGGVAVGVTVDDGATLSFGGGAPCNYPATAAAGTTDVFVVTYSRSTVTCTGLVYLEGALGGSEVGVSVVSGTNGGFAVGLTSNDNVNFFGGVGGVAGSSGAGGFPQTSRGIVVVFEAAVSPTGSGDAPVATYTATCEGLGGGLGGRLLALESDCGVPLGRVGGGEAHGCTYVALYEHGGAIGADYGLGLVPGPHVAVVRYSVQLQVLAVTPIAAAHPFIDNAALATDEEGGVWVSVLMDGGVWVGVGSGGGSGSRGGGGSMTVSAPVARPQYVHVRVHGQVPRVDEEVGLIHGTSVAFNPAGNTLAGRVSSGVGGALYGTFQMGGKVAYNVRRGVAGRGGVGEGGDASPPLVDLAGTLISDSVMFRLGADGRVEQFESLVAGNPSGTVGPTVSSLVVTGCSLVFGGTTGSTPDAVLRGGSTVALASGIVFLASTPIPGCHDGQRGGEATGSTQSVAGGVTGEVALLEPMMFADSVYTGTLVAGVRAPAGVAGGEYVVCYDVDPLGGPFPVAVSDFGLSGSAVGPRRAVLVTHDAEGGATCVVVVHLANGDVTCSALSPTLGGGAGEAGSGGGYWATLYANAPGPETVTVNSFSGPSKTFFTAGGGDVVLLRVEGSCEVKVGRAFGVAAANNVPVDGALASIGRGGGVASGGGPGTRDGGGAVLILTTDSDNPFSDGTATATFVAGPPAGGHLVLLVDSHGVGVVAKHYSLGNVVLDQPLELRSVAVDADRGVVYVAGLAADAGSANFGGAVGSPTAYPKGVSVLQLGSVRSGVAALEAEVLLSWSAVGVDSRAAAVIVRAPEDGGVWVAATVQDTVYVDGAAVTVQVGAGAGILCGAVALYQRGLSLVSAFSVGHVDLTAEVQALEVAAGSVWVGGVVSNTVAADRLLDATDAKAPSRVFAVLHLRPSTSGLPFVFELAAYGGDATMQRLLQSVPRDGRQSAPAQRLDVMGMGVVGGGVPGVVVLHKGTGPSTSWHARGSRTRVRSAEPPVAAETEKSFCLFVASVAASMPLAAVWEGGGVIATRTPEGSFACDRPAAFRVVSGLVAPTRETLRYTWFDSEAATAAGGGTMVQVQDNHCGEGEDLANVYPTGLSFIHPTSTQSATPLFCSDVAVVGERIYVAGRDIRVYERSGAASWTYKGSFGRFLEVSSTTPLRVAASGAYTVSDVVVVGVPGASGGGTYLDATDRASGGVGAPLSGRGAAVVYERASGTEAWYEVAHLKPFFPYTAAVGFGSSVSVSEDGHVIAVGAPGDALNNFPASGWLSVLTSPTGTNTAPAGGSVSVFYRSFTGSAAAPAWGDGYWGAGILLKERSGAAGRRFGASVSVSGAGSGAAATYLVAVGSPADGAGGGGSGRVYVYSLLPPTAAVPPFGVSGAEMRCTVAPVIVTTGGSFAPSVNTLYGAAVDIVVTNDATADYVLVVGAPRHGACGDGWYAAGGGGFPAGVCADRGGAWVFEGVGTSFTFIGAFKGAGGVAEVGTRVGASVSAVAFNTLAPPANVHVAVGAPGDSGVQLGKAAHAPPTVGGAPRGAVHSLQRSGAVWSYTAANDLKSLHSGGRPRDLGGRGVAATYDSVQGKYRWGGCYQTEQAWEGGVNPNAFIARAGVESGGFVAADL